MYEVTNGTGDRVAVVRFNPYEYTMVADAPGVEQVLGRMTDLKQMNRKPPKESPAFVLPEESTDSTTGLEGWDDADDDFRLNRISLEIRPAYYIGDADTDQAEAARLFAASFGEGDKVEWNGERAIVVEIRTESFEGPDGSDVDASDDSPAYVIATEDGAEAVTADELTLSDWSTGGDRAKELADDMGGSAEAEQLEAGPTDWDYPDSWDESDTPNRLILLDAWSSMGGQFDCGGGCCKGTMMKGGMSDGASDRFCASMKDRVLMWEGWRS